jgi:dienelactone hydrolase
MPTKNNFAAFLLTALLIAGATTSPTRAQTPAAATAPTPSAPAPAVLAVPSLVTSIPPNSIRLWEGDAPGALGQRPQDIPTLTPYLPASGGNGAAMIVLPGGGYSNLAAHEGTGYAEWLASKGVAAYVLRYRLGSQGYHHPAELTDIARAVRMVRSFARKSGGLDANRIGVIGSSAGGHLAGTIATHFDAGKPAAADPIERESSRPDVVVLCYPVITFGEFAHAGSRKQLLGDNPSPELIKDLSVELQVTAETPPCFIWATVADKTVPVENSMMFAAALRRAGVPYSLHIYETGAHGLGLGRPDRPAPPWADQCLYWLHERKFLP